MVEVRERGVMKPQCYMPLLYLNWVLYLGVIAWAGLTGRYVLSSAWALAFPAFMLAYLALFPRFSRLLGYGSVEDEPAERGREEGAGTGQASGAEPEVVLYKAVGCPFCPIVERRLDDLEQEGGFTLRKVDVTLRPGTLAAKGIKAVPVVEAGAERLTGNATSRELVALVERSRRAGAAGAPGTGGASGGLP
jgi:glutaredoxin